MISTPAEHLRIIDDQLWEQVKQRQLAINQASAEIRAALHVNARTGRRPKYLFSGLLVCGQCGRKFVVLSPTEYGCSGRKYRLSSVCTSTSKVSRQLVESLLLAAIPEDLFNEEGYAIVKREVARLLAERRRNRTSGFAQAKARLAALDQEIAHLMAAIKAGIITVATKSELVKLEDEQRRLRVTVQDKQPTDDRVTSFLPNTIGRVRAVLADLTAVTQYQVDKARGILRRLLGEEIVLHPTANGKDRYLTAEVSGDYAGLFRLVTGKTSLVEARGVEPLSEDLQRTGSTCVADSFRFAATHAHRLA